MNRVHRIAAVPVLLVLAAACAAPTMSGGSARSEPRPGTAPGADQPAAAAAPSWLLGPNGEPGGDPTPSASTPSAAPSATTPSPTTSDLPSPAASTSPAQPSGPSTTERPPADSAAPTDVLRPGMQGAAVLALQQRLAALGFWLGTPDGDYGYLTQQAVLAFQKAAGLPRDSIAGAATQAALATAHRPTARSTSGHVLEVDLDRQLLLVVDSGAVTTVFNTSTGSGRRYTYHGQRYLAATPTGHYEISRQIDGMRDGPLGQLWRPKYFNGGIAVHGSGNVPAYPASHGCVRVSNAAINWIWSSGSAPVGTPVWVY